MLQSESEKFAVTFYFRHKEQKCKNNTVALVGRALTIWEAI